MDIQKTTTFYSDGKEKKIRFSIEYEFDLLDRIVGKLPKSCYECPVGFQNSNDTCGRNIPWTYIDSKQRPSTCKLITFNEYLRRNHMYFTIKDGLIYEYLKNRKEDESYDISSLTAGYWLHHAGHDPLGEFRKMVKSLDQEDNQFYIETEQLIIEALNQ